MSPRLKSPRSYLVLTFIGAIMCMAATTAIELAALKLGGSTISKFNRKHCDDQTAEVRVELPAGALKGNNDVFRFRINNIKDKDGAKAESTCKATMAVNPDEKQKFDKDDPKILIKKYLLEGACGETGSNQSRELCIYEGNGGEDLLARVVFGISTKSAKITSVESEGAINGEAKFKITYDDGAGSIGFEVCYVEVPTNDDEARKIIDILEKTSDCEEKDDGLIKKSFTAAEFNVTNLENYKRYAFRFRLKEEGGATSKWWDETFYETPVRATFPLNTYKGKGGEFQFNCQQSSGSSLLMLGIALFLLLALRLRSHKAITPTAMAALLVVVVLLESSPSHARLGQMNVGLLGSMYRPDLDSEKLSSGELFPFYKCFFRRNPADKLGPINPLLGAEFDWHLWDGFGSLQLGFGVGYTFKTGHALEVDADGNPMCDSPVPREKVTLHMYQLRPQLTYIFDPFADYFPLVPYIRGALIGHGYIFSQSKTAPTAVNADGDTIKPNGFRFGYQAAVGLMLRLDFLEPGAVRDATGAGLFEHIYLKGELSYTKIDTFGRPGFQFSAKDVMGTKLPLMWTFGLVFQLP